MQHVLGAASHLEIIPVVDTCSTYLASQLDLDNFVDITTIAETYTLTSLCQTAYLFIARNLNKIAGLYEFQRMNKRQLSHLLSMPYPIECTESDVLESVICWLHYEHNFRAKYVSDLLSLIQFFQIPEETCSRILKSTACNVISEHYPEIQSIIMNGMYEAQMNLEKKDLPLGSPGMINFRGLEEAIVNVGGFQASTGMTNMLSYYHKSDDQWKHLTEIPHVDQTNFGVAVLENEIFVVGGCFNQSLEENVHPFGFKYNIYSQQWTSIAPMLNERCGFYLGSMGKRLFAIGGVDDHEDTPAPPCECYNPETDTWTEVSAPPGCTKQHAGTTLENCIYISGGLDWDTVNNSLWCYNVDNNSWTIKANMLQPRADHCMTAFRGKLYIIGGWREDLATGNRVVTNSLDCYDPTSDQWQTLCASPCSRYHAGIAILGPCLYVIGGVEHPGFNGASRKIDVYDFDQNSWHEEDYPDQIWEQQSCVVYLPLFK